MSERYGYYEHYEVKPIYKAEEGKYQDKDDALLPSKIIVNPTDSKYNPERQLQVTTTMSVVSPKGRIFLSYFSAEDHADEDVGNWNMIITSDDGGKTFQNRFAVEPPNPKNTRIAEMNLWIDDLGRLWLFWCQGYRTLDGRQGIWVACCEDPDAEVLEFSQPRRIAHGMMITKPIITKSGEWLFPAYIAEAKWAQGSPKITDTYINWLPEEMGVSVYSSKDKGKTFEKIASQIRFPYSVFEEPCMVERSDGSLMMWIRGMNCTAQSFSYDGGHTWTVPMQNPKMNLPNTHFHFGKLKSGNILLLANYKADMFSYFGGRNNLTALISKDDGVTWEGFLMIDEREGAEQPDFTEGEDGYIYISYGRAPQYAAETLLAIVTEEEILAGKLVNPNSKLRIVAHKGTGMRYADYYESWTCKTARENNIEL